LILEAMIGLQSMIWLDSHHANAMTISSPAMFM